jgi:hypothetical protein
MKVLKFLILTSIAGLAAPLCAQNPKHDQAMAALTARKVSIFQDRIYKGLEVYYPRYATDEDLTPLFDLDNVVRLQMSHADISDAGLARLKQLTALRSIDIPRCRASAEGAADLKQALPKCSVYYTPRRSPISWGKMAFAFVFWGGCILLGLWFARSAWRRVDKPYAIRQKAFGMGILLMLAGGVLFTVTFIQALGFEFTLSDLIDVF